jgi:predicted short-subunit dehydrogenase-like oxidoreductase (DUF2520 family)
MLSSAIIGSGNLAHHLVQAMLNANIDLKGIWARDTDKAKEMGQFYGVPVFNALNQIPQETDLVLLAISDGAIEQLANGIQTHGIIAHCSGILPVASLGSKQHCGVFWPVQTFSKNQKIDFDLPKNREFIQMITAWYKTYMQRFGEGKREKRKIKGMIS